VQRHYDGNHRQWTASSYAIRRCVDQPETGVRTEVLIVLTSPKETSALDPDPPAWAR
jgi:hypothetical protein